MINRKVLDAMNVQIKHELESAYLYLSIAAYFEFEGFEGMAKWMHVQYQEEISHAMKFFHHINARDERIILKPLEMSKTEWDSPLEAFKDTYEHEKFISGKINDLMKLAIEESDYPTKVLLDWFVEEQVEEEDSALKIVQKLERIGKSSQGLIMIDHELGQREFK
jgi:ferritin